MQDATQSFAALSEEFVEVTLRHDPVAATRAGLHDYDQKLPDDSPEGLRARAAWLRDIDQRLVASVPWEELPLESRVDFALMRSMIASARADLEEIKLHARNPVLFPTTALHGVFLLMSRSFAPLDERKEAVLERLMAIPDYLASAGASLKQPSELLVRVAGEVTLSGPPYVEEVVRTLLRNFPGEAERIEHAGERARVGFVQYQDFLDRELRPRATGTFAIGERWMNYKLERQHMLSFDCASLEALARDRVASTQARLEQEARRRDPARGWREQVTEGSQRHPEPLRLRDAYVAEVERAQRFVQEHKLAPLPAGTLEVIDAPAFERPTTPYASYLAPAPFDEEAAGRFCVTPIDHSRPPAEQLSELRGHHYAALPLTVVHETWPGRHLQKCHAFSRGSRLRRLSDADLLSRGWGLYAETLMGDHGYFLDSLAALFQLKNFLWRACRVVVDVGLHTGRMTYEQAVSYLVDEALLERSHAEREVVNCALAPTRALTDLIGKEMLDELRDESRSRMGAAFDLSDFHAELLRVGTLPPFLVREELGGRLTPR